MIEIIKLVALLILYARNSSVLLHILTHWTVWLPHILVINMKNIMFNLILEVFSVPHRIILPLGAKRSYLIIVIFDVLTTVWKDTSKLLSYIPNILVFSLNSLCVCACVCVVCMCMRICVCVCLKCILYLYWNLIILEFFLTR